MSDEITNPEGDVTPQPETATNAEPQGNAEIDWKKEARKWESRAKEAQAFKEQADKWREYESSQKTEHEKMAEELARLKAEASQASAELLRFKIASEKGITGDATRLLKGSTQEELEAEAELLLSLIADQSKKPSLQPDENQGKPAPSNIGQITEAELATMTPAEIVKAKAEGRLADLMSGKK